MLFLDHRGTQGNKAMRYFIMIIKHDPESDWEVDFGSYDKQEVRDEMRVAEYGKPVRMLNLDNDQQSYINDFMRRYNENWRSN